MEHGLHGLGQSRIGTEGELRIMELGSLFTPGSVLGLPLKGAGPNQAHGESQGQEAGGEKETAATGCSHRPPPINAESTFLHQSK
jgi:hypothetical protein